VDGEKEISNLFQVWSQLSLLVKLSNPILATAYQYTDNDIVLNNNGNQ
jgi:hypothetical protein